MAYLFLWLSMVTYGYPWLPIISYYYLSATPCFVCVFFFFRIFFFSEMYDWITLTTRYVTNRPLASWLFIVQVHWNHSVNCQYSDSEYIYIYLASIEFKHMYLILPIIYLASIEFKHMYLILPIIYLASIEFKHMYLILPIIYLASIEFKEFQILISMQVEQGGAPTVISWFINHNKYRYNPHKP